MIARVFAMAKSTFRRNAAHRGNGRLGIIGIFGLLIELKHGLPEIRMLFDKCNTLADYWHTAWSLDDLQFLGVLALIIILITSAIAFGLGVAEWVVRVANSTR
jgi:hypothetical protein